jgi:hypothetical protein
MVICQRYFNDSVTEFQLLFCLIIHVPDVDSFAAGDHNFKILPLQTSAMIIKADTEVVAF